MKRLDPRLVWVLAGAGALAGVALLLAAAATGGLRFGATGGFLPGVGGISFAGGGLEVGPISCSQIVFQTGKATSGICVTEATVTGGTQAVVGGFSKDAIAGGTLPATFDFKSEVKSVEEVKKFTIRSADTVFALGGNVMWGWDNANTHGELDIQSGTQNTAAPNGFSMCPTAFPIAIELAAVKPLFQGTWRSALCLQKVQIGSYGTMSDGGGRAVIDVTFERVGGSVERVKLDTDVSSAVQTPFGGRLVWLGGLDTLAVPPDVSRVQAAWVDASPGWKLIDSTLYGAGQLGSAWTGWDGWKTTTSGDCLTNLWDTGNSCWARRASGRTGVEGDAITAGVIRQWVLSNYGTVNNIITNVVSSQATIGELSPTSVLGDKTARSIEVGGGDSKTTTTANGRLDIVSSRLLHNYRLKYELPAAWLGVFQSSGIPKITLATCDFTAGSIGAIKVSIQNVGTGAGQFALSLSGGQNIRLLGTAPTVNLGAGASTVVNMPVAATLITGAFTEALTINAVDQTSFEKSSASASCSVQQATKCTPDGSTSTADAGVLICQAGGWKLLKSCTSGTPTFKGGDKADPANYVCPQDIIVGMQAPGAGVSAQATFQPATTGGFVRPAGFDMRILLIAVAILAVAAIAVAAILRRRQPPMEEM